MHRKLTALWFILGLGYKLQVVASLSITEIIVLVATPIVCIKDYQYMKRDGVMPFFILSLMVIVGCIVASIANRTSMQYVLRGLAVTCLVPSSIIFSHWVLRRDPAGFKWFVLGVPLSAIISTFFFKTSVEMTMLGESSEEIMSGSIYWTTRLIPLCLAPIRGWYLSVPGFVSALMPLALSAFSILTTASGRSAALSSIGFAALVIIGGKSRKSMSLIPKNFGKLCVAGVVLIGTTYTMYKVAANSGWLGDDARKKYEAQTAGGQGGIGRLILGGRGDSFIGLLACRDKPIVGWGPWAADENDYAEEFIRKYGTWEDFEQVVQLRQWQARNGIATRMLSCHSYITEFWAWYGIWGLIFWLYVIFVLLRYLKQDVAVVPQWYAWLACSIPGMFWGIFFSPFSDRFGVPLFVVACLMARAVRKGQMQLPYEMFKEIEKVERK